MRRADLALTSRVDVGVRRSYRDALFKHTHFTQMLHNENQSEADGPEECECLSE